MHASWELYVSAVKRVGVGLPSIKINVEYWSHLSNCLSQIVNNQPSSLTASPQAICF